MRKATAKRDSLFCCLFNGSYLDVATVMRCVGCATRDVRYNAVKDKPIAERRQQSGGKLLLYVSERLPRASIDNLGGGREVLRWCVLDNKCVADLALLYPFLAVAERYADDLCMYGQVDDIVVGKLRINRNLDGKFALVVFRDVAYFDAKASRQLIADLFGYVSDVADIVRANIQTFIVIIVKVNIVADIATLDIVLHIRIAVFDKFYNVRRCAAKPHLARLCRLLRGRRRVYQPARGGL